MLINKYISVTVKRDRERGLPAVFCDFQKAYDTVKVGKLLVAVKKEGVNGVMLDWIADLLRNRRMEVRVGEKSSAQREDPHGLPQGSILSPLLYCVFINSIFDDALFAPNDEDQAPSTVTQIHCDDASFAVRIENNVTPQQAAALLNRYVTAVARWSIQNRQLISTEKNPSDAVLQ
jgi:hypothetical protein